MKELISYLLQKGFTKATKIETLKVTLSPVKHKDTNVDIPSPDKRYYWDGKAFGLHVSSVELNINFWIRLIELLEINKDLISVLYIVNTDLQHFEPATLAHLTFLNLSQNKALEFVILTNFSQLSTLNITHCQTITTLELKGKFDKLEKLDVSYCPKLSSLAFPTRFPKLRFFYGVNTNLENDYIAFGEYFGEELREKLIAFLKFKGLLKEDSLIPPNRYQVILIGNTTAGKTEMRLALTGEQRNPNEPISTHGVYIFQYSLGQQEVFGYDFGGQDYYHALHLPFYDDKTLYILVWGNYHEWKWGSGESDEFGLKIEEIKIKGSPKVEVENILYPLSYWLGSLLYQRGRSTSLRSQEIEQAVSKDKRKLEIIQNVRVDAPRFYLNTKALKTHPHLDVGDIVDFDIHTQKEDVKQWLEKRIKARELLDTQPVSKTTYDFGQQLLAENKAFYTAEELTQKFREVENINDKVEFKALAQTLHSNRLGFWPQQSTDFFIARLDLFSKFVHQILSKELATNDANAGYFTKKEAKERTSPTLGVKEIELVLNFLETENVIFKVENEDKYVAPAYLPLPKSKVDILLLESFEKPDCYWEFEGYFHSNIILQIIEDQKDNLIYDPSCQEYLLWKNIILIYTNTEIEKRSREYLLIQLEYPNEANKLRKPRLSLSRNKAKFVNDEDFRDSFKYLEDKLRDFEGVKCWIKTPIEQEGIPRYIPMQIIEECDKKQSGKYAHLVFFEGVYFNRFEFKHFKEMGERMPAKVFVAYSKSDDEFRTELRSHLRPYEKSGDLIVFDDRDLELGSAWDAELKKQLLECDIFVCLVSINTLNTSYVVDLEIPEANRLGKPIIPVILSPCNWYEERFGLSQFNANDKGKVISLCYHNFGEEKQSLQPLGKHERAEKWTELVRKIVEVSKSIKPSKDEYPERRHSQAS